MTRHLVVIGMTLLVAHRAAGQAARVDSLVPAPARHALDSVFAGAAADHLPAEPLIERALEGVRRGVDPSRVVTAVRALADRMRTARAALGPGSSDAELVAGAGALYAGVERTTLASLRRAEPKRDLALPLIVMADIIERGVPRDTATYVIQQLTRAHVRDVDYQVLRQSILLDIGAGAPPAAAAMARTRGLLVAAPRSPE